DSFDPQVGVGVGACCVGGGRGAQCAAVGVAPVQRVLGGRAGAVARGVDHEMGPVGLRRDRFAVAELLVGGVVVGGVQGETPRVLDTGRVEPGGHLVGADPAGVTGI